MRILPRQQPGVTWGIALMAIAGAGCMALGITNSLTAQTLGPRVTVFFFFLAVWSAVECLRLYWIRRVVAAGRSPLDSRGLALTAIVEGVLFGGGAAYQLNSHFGTAIGALVACLGAAPLIAYAVRMRPRQT